MSKVVSAFLKDETGATAVEYALLIALIAGTLTAAFTGLANGISTEFGNITKLL